MPPGSRSAWFWYAIGTIRQVLMWIIFWTFRLLSPLYFYQEMIGLCRHLPFCSTHTTLFRGIRNIFIHGLALVWRYGVWLMIDDTMDVDQTQLVYSLL